MARRSEELRDWYSVIRVCAVCGKLSTEVRVDAHHRTPKGREAYLPAEYTSIDDWKNLCGLCREHHDIYNSTMGAKLSLSELHKEQRIANAKKLLARDRRYWKALPDKLQAELAERDLGLDLGYTPKEQT